MTVRSEVIKLDRERRVRFDAFALSELERVYKKDMIEIVGEVQEILERGAAIAAQKAEKGEPLTVDELQSVKLPFRLVFCLCYAGVCRDLPAGYDLEDFSSLLDKMPGSPLTALTDVVPIVLKAFFDAMIQSKNEESPDEEIRARMDGTGLNSNGSAINSDSIQSESTG